MGNAEACENKALRGDFMTTAVARARALAIGVTIVVCLLLLGTGIRYAVSSQQRLAATDAKERPATRSEPVAFRGTLMLFLGTDCIYCEKSLSFYRPLLASRNVSGFRVVAVFDESIGLAREYLRQRELDVDDVRQTDFRLLDIKGTPTLRLFDRADNELKTWTGLLSPPAQGEIVDSLGAREAFVAAAKALSRQQLYQNAARTKPISAAEFAALMRSGTAPVIIDTRSRTAFRRGHIASAVSMPFDEIESRAPIELGEGGSVFVFCQYDRACEEDQRARHTLTQCMAAGALLKGMGVSDVRLVTATLDELRAENAPIDTTSRPNLARITIAQGLP
jgi:hypothetical protein